MKLKYMAALALGAALAFSFSACGAEKKAPARPEVPAAKENVKFDMKNKMVTLNNGRKMPILGIGTWTMSNDFAEKAVYEHLKLGGRLIDTALYYNTQAGVGRGVRRAIADGICRREDVFITTKIAPFAGGNYRELIRQCNEELGLSYIDLMLVHQAGSGDQALYGAIEDAVDEGIVKSAGISNYYTPDEYDRMTKNVRIKPAVIQNENHLFYQNRDLQNYVAKDGTVIESYYPLGGRGHTKDSLGHPAVLAVSKKYGKTPAQVILRWQLQNGYIVIPGIDKLDYIREDLDLFDFTLSEEEMKTLNQLDTGKRYENW